MKNSAFKTLAIASGLSLLFSLGTFYSIGNIRNNNFTHQDTIEAQSLACSNETLSTIGNITFSNSTLNYGAQVECLLPGTIMYQQENRFTFFNTPSSLQGRQIAFIKTENIAMKANPQLSWNVQITRPADFYVFYRKIPGQTFPSWLSSYTKVTSDNYSNLLSFLLRKNDQGLIGVYDIYKKTLNNASSVSLGPASSASGEAFSMYIAGVSPQTAAPSSSSSPLPSAQAKTGIWLSATEIARLPTTGVAWSSLKARADSAIGTANLADQNLQHDQNTLAVSLVAAKTGQPNYRAKAVAAILSAIGTDANSDPDCETSPSKARSLGLSRNLPSYIIASDIINLRSGTDGADGKRWEDYVNYIRFKKNCRNNGSVPEYTLSESHDNGSSNGDALAGGARMAAALYLGDKAEVEKAWQTYQRYSGDSTKCPSCKPNINDAGITWSHTANVGSQVAVNPAGSIKNGQRIDGAIVNDQGRGGAFKWPPGYTAYPWEGLQGFIMQAELLQRAGYPAYAIQNNAPLRALDYQYYLSQQFGAQWFNDEPWVTWVVNKAYGKTYPTRAVSGGGKNMSWTDWSHQ
ncbi:MAG: hypothetical protein M3Q44_06430 [bacterium]|nr:hypothetical protein [bacterium]